jgi:aminoglycoside phosphotransferase (APT) family kinase protein
VPDPGSSSSEPLAAAPFESDRLADWASAHVGAAVSDVEVLRTNTSGFDSDIIFVRFRGTDLPAEWNEELVLRVKHARVTLADAQAEAAMHGWLVEQGYPAPAVLAVVEPGVVSDGPTQIVQVAPGVSLFDAAKRRPWTVGTLLDRFAALQNRLHLLPVAGCPADGDVVEKRLRLPRAVADNLGHAGVQAGVAQMEALADRLHDAPPSICHGDYHPLNALVDGDRVTIIDWTDAGLGDRHCDVARTVALYDIASIVAGSAIERRALEFVGPRIGASYRRRYDAGLAIDPERLALWMPIHLLHDWSQALAGSERDSTMPAEMAVALGERFERALAAVPPG